MTSYIFVFLCLYLFPLKLLFFYLKIKICYFSNDIENKKGILSINILFYFLKSTVFTYILQFAIMNKKNS